MAFDRRHDSLAGLGIGLADDLGQLGGRHASLLQLGKGSACANRTELLHVADQHHARTGFASAREQPRHVMGR